MHTANQNMRDLRKRHQLTQEQMAHKLGIKRSLLGAYEEARANPRLEVLVKAAELFNISVDQLVSEHIGEDKEISEAFLSQHPTETEKYPYAVDMPLSPKHGPVRHHKRDKEAKPSQPVTSYLPPRKIDFPSTEINKSLQRLRLVPEKEFKQYFFKSVEQEYLENLPELILPLPSIFGVQYRAFELTNDAMQLIHPGDFVVGQKIENIQSIRDGKLHILITRHEGILFRRVFNHIKSAGNLLLEADHQGNGPIELSVLGKEIEAWEVILHVSSREPVQTLPLGSEQPVNLAELSIKVGALQEEVMRLKKTMDAYRFSS